MKKLLSFIALSGLLLATGNIFAQGNKAKTLLDNLSAKIKTTKSISANFNISVNDANGKSRMNQSGSFKMKGIQYKITLKDGQQIISDAKSVWTYLPANKEVQVSAYDPSEQTISPAKLFSGSFEKDYNYTYSGNKTVEGQKVEVVTLTPKTKQSYSKILLYIHPTQSMITGGIVYDKNGGSYSYKISNVNTTQILNNSEFQFNSKAHPGVEVIDLR